MHAPTTRCLLTRQAVSALQALAPLVTIRVQRRCAVAAAHTRPPSSPRAPGVCPHDALAQRGGWWCAAPTRRPRLHALWPLIVLVVLGTATTAAAQVVR